MITRARLRSRVFLYLLKEHKTSIDAGVSASAHPYDHPPIKFEQDRLSQIVSGQRARLHEHSNSRSTKRVETLGRGNSLPNFYIPRITKLMIQKQEKGACHCLDIGDLSQG